MEHNFTQFLIKNEYKYYACVLNLKKTAILPIRDIFGFCE